MEQQQPGPDGQVRKRGDGEDRKNFATDFVNVGAEAVSQVRDQAGSGKNRAAEGVGHTAEAARSAAERLREQEPWLADLVSRGADELTQLADTLRTNDLRTILGRTEDLARRQPMLAAGTAFAAGFAAMRAARAGAVPAAANLSEVARSATEMVRRESGNTMGGAKRTVEAVSGDSSDQQQPGRRENTGAETRSTVLGQ